MSFLQQFQENWKRKSRRSLSLRHLLWHIGIITYGNLKYPRLHLEPMTIRNSNVSRLLLLRQTLALIEPMRRKSFRFWRKQRIWRNKKRTSNILWNDDDGFMLRNIIKNRYYSLPWRRWNTFVCFELIYWIDSTDYVLQLRSGSYINQSRLV